MKAIDLLKRYAAWEAKLLNDDNTNIIDTMSDDCYNEMMELQGLRNQILEVIEGKPL